MYIKPNILIFSVFQKSLAEPVNKMVHNTIFSILEEQGFPVMELEGQYDGVKELSILIKGFEHRDTVARLCSEFNQECYLESHNDRSTFLVYPDGKTKSIGTLTNVTKNEAQSFGSYSYDPLGDNYFIAK